MQRILVVDDEKDIRDLLAEYLTGHDYQVTTCGSGEEALEMAQQEDFDLVMCDFKLGGMDGFDVLIRLKDIKPDMPFIVMTGFADLKMAVQLMRRGAYDYITKPMDTEEIINTVKNALAEAKVQQSLREASIAKQSEADNNPASPNLKESALKAELEVIQRVLKEVNYNRTKAAKILGIDRKTLYNKLRALDNQ
jgi:two-component system response regulator HydG